MKLKIVAAFCIVSLLLANSLSAQESGSTIGQHDDRVSLFEVHNSVPNIIFSAYLLLLVALCAGFAIFSINMSLKALTVNKISYIKFKLLYLLFSIAMAPALIFNSIRPFEAIAQSPQNLSLLLFNAFFIASMIIIYFAFKGSIIYMYCVSDDDFRMAIISSLKAHSIGYIEGINNLQLLDQDKKIAISFSRWKGGGGMLKLDNKKDFNTFTSIMKMTQESLFQNNIKPEKVKILCWLLIGILLITICIIFTLLFIVGIW